MNESRLEEKTKKTSIFKQINDFTFKIMAYIMDRIPMNKNVSADNCVVYGRISKSSKNYIAHSCDFPKYTKFPEEL